MPRPSVNPLITSYWLPGTIKDNRLRDDHSLHFCDRFRIYHKITTIYSWCDRGTISTLKLSMRIKRKFERTIRSATFSCDIANTQAIAHQNSKDNYQLIANWKKWPHDMVFGLIKNSYDYFLAKKPAYTR